MMAEARTHSGCGRLAYATYLLVLSKLPLKFQKVLTFTQVIHYAAGKNCY
jgi:hypothetical protein